MLPDEAPKKELRTRLKEKWICPKSRTMEAFGEVLVLEQFQRRVNGDVRHWIKEIDRAPPSRLFNEQIPSSLHARVPGATNLEDHGNQLLSR
ncbi:unnamed protein product [Lota lota]